MFPRKSSSHINEAYFNYEMTEPIEAPAKQKQLQDRANLQKVIAFVATGLVLGAVILFVVAKCVLKRFMRPTVLVEEQPIPTDSAQNQAGSEDVIG